MRCFAAAAARNREPILEALRAVLPTSGRVLEVASGTGEHVTFFAGELPQLSFVASDIDRASLASIAAWIEHAGVRNVEPPIMLDVTQRDWELESIDAIFCSNMLHIAPQAATTGLLEGAARVLPRGGVLVIYGPFVGTGEPTAPSNEAFDRDLRRRDPRFGLRDLGAVKLQARGFGLVHQCTLAMPANNLTVVFERD